MYSDGFYKMEAGENACWRSIFGVQGCEISKLPFFYNVFADIDDANAKVYTFLYPEDDFACL